MVTVVGPETSESTDDCGDREASFLWNENIAQDSGREPGQ
jgi:hypothetical protein